MAERAVIGSTWLWGDGTSLKEGRFLSLIEELFVSTWLVQVGFGILWQRVIWTGLLTAIIAGGLWFVERTFGPEMLTASAAIGAGCVYFGLPSRTILSSLSEESVEKLAGGLRDLVYSPADVAALAASVQLIKTQSLERLSRFNVFAGIVWAAFFWFVGSRLLSPTVTVEVIRQSMIPTVFCGAAFFALMLFSAAYAAAVRTVFLTIDFSLLETRREVEEGAGAPEPDGFAIGPTLVGN